MSPLPSQVLVTGANGFVGSALCSALAEAGYSVRRAVRSVSTLDGATFAIGEVAANPDWPKALAEAVLTFYRMDASERRALGNRAFFRNEAFLVAHADNLTKFDVRAFIARHVNRPAGVVITMMTFASDTPHTCGIVVEDDWGVVREFHEKVPNPPGNRANGAVYIFEPEVIGFLESFGKPVIDLSTEVLPHYLGRIGTFFNSDYHRDIGSLESLRKAELEFPSH